MCQIYVTSSVRAANILASGLLLKIISFHIVSHIAFNIFLAKNFSFKLNIFFVKAYIFLLMKAHN